jgi:hypothetical protein
LACLIESRAHGKGVQGCDKPGRLWGTLARSACSLLCAGLVYAAWLALFLLIISRASPFVEAILRLLTLVTTAAGFALGITLFERLAAHSRTAFFRILIWPLVGCAVGAGVVYWFGPMLIVFGMFAAGTVSIALREVYLWRSSQGRAE